MEVLETDELDRPDQVVCPSATVQGSCGHCAKAMEQLNQGSESDEPLPLGQVLLVFFLPLLCAAVLVIAAVSCISKLAEHPGYLALSALGVACLAVVLAKIFTRRPMAPKRG